MVTSDAMYRTCFIVALPRHLNRWFQVMDTVRKPLQYQSQARAVGRLTRTLKPNCTGINFEDNLATWEDEILKYEKETATTLPNDAKIAVMMNGATGPLSKTSSSIERS